MTCLRYAKERDRRFSCTRGLNLTLANGDPCELDVFMLIDGKLPICIECKSGEFRQNIDRYLALPILVHGDAAFAGQGVVGSAVAAGVLLGILGS